MSGQGTLRKITLAVLAICTVIFAYSVVADRFAPYSNQGVVQAFVVGIAPDVAGRVIEVNVKDNQIVRAGDVLFRIDPESYQIAVRQAEARLQAAGQNVGASTANVAATQAKLVEAMATRDNVREQSTRVLELVQRGVYAGARGDQARSQRAAAEAGVKQAEAELEEARQALGSRGSDNPQIRDALASLELAQLNLVRTSVLAPAEGLVTNLELAVGRFATAGQPLMTFIDVTEVWLSVAFRENSLGNLAPGARAEVVFDVLPGRVYSATVESIGWGVANSSSQTTSGGLPTIRTDTGWIRDPQRFNVRVKMDTARPPRGVRLGSQASVVVYASGDPVTSAVGWLWMRTVAWLTYLS